MFSILDPRLWLATLALVVTSSLGGYFYGTRVEGLSSAAREATANSTALTQLAQLTSENEVISKSLRGEITTLELKAKLEKDHAKSQIDALRNDVRNGDVRLSVAVSSCRSTPFSSGTTITGGTASQAYAELLPKTADDLIGIAADANDEVRRTNLCIDTYNSVMTKINGGPK